MFDRRFPWMFRLGNAPVDVHGRRRITRAGNEISSRCFCSVVWDDRRGGLFCYVGEIDSGVHFVKMRRPDGGICDLDRTELDTAVLYIQCARQPKRVKDEWARHHQRNDEIDTQILRDKNRGDRESSVREHADFLDRRRRGTATMFSTG